MSGIYDRGTIKWTSLMLPEHQELLHEMWHGKEKKEKPMMDEQELEEINMKLQLAIHDDLPVKIKYFSEHDYKVVKGKLKQINGIEKYLQLDDFTKIRLGDVLEVHVE